MIRRSYLVLLSIAVTHGACKARQEPSGSAVLADTGSAGTASGKLGDYVDWEIHQVLPFCEHDGKPGGVWCDESDRARVRSQNTVRPALMKILQDPTLKSVHILTPMLSDRELLKVLCDRKSEQPSVHLYIPQVNVDSVRSAMPAGCDRSVVTTVLPNVYNAGSTGVTTVLATEDDVVSGENSGPGAAIIVQGNGPLSNAAFTFNQSVWQFYRTNTKTRLAETAICDVRRLERVAQNFPPADSERFYATCVQNITAPQIAGIQWSGASRHPPASSMKVVGPETARAVRLVKDPAVVAENAKIETIVDDDVLLAGKCNGGRAEASASAVSDDRLLRERGGSARYVQTNGALPQFSRPQFQILDDAVVLTSVVRAASITDPAMVQTYVDFWARLQAASLAADAIPESQNGDREVKFNPGIGAFEFVENPECP